MGARLLFRVVPLVYLTLAALSIAPLPLAEASNGTAGVRDGRMAFRPMQTVERGGHALGLGVGSGSTRAMSPGREYPRQVLGRHPDRIGAREPFSFSERTGARKAVPVTRGQELGLRFRPDERASPYGQAIEPPTASDSEPYSPEIQSQFRPLPKRRKPSYEEQQADTMSVQPPPPPTMSYPMPVPPPVPGYTPAWPLW